MAAGIATAGIALGGFIPHHYVFLGTIVAITEFVILSVSLTVYFIQKYKSPRTIESECTHLGIEPTTQRANRALIETNASLDPHQMSTHVIVDDVLLEIFKYLNFQELATTYCVCKRWKKIALNLSKQLLEQWSWLEESPNYGRVLGWLHRFETAKESKRTVIGNLGTLKRFFHHIMHRPDHLYLDSCSGNRWIHVGNSESDASLVAQIYSVSSQNNLGALTLQKSITLGNGDTGIAAIGFYGNELYANVYPSNDVIVWNLQTGQSQSWSNVYTPPSDFCLMTAHATKMITVMKEKVLTYDADECKLWRKKDRTLLAEHAPIYGKSVYEGKWNDEYAEEIFTFLGSDHTIGNKHYVYKDRILHLDLNHDPCRIMAYYPRSGRHEIMIECHEYYKSRKITKMLIEGNILFVQLTYTNIHMYDLKQKKLLRSLRFKNYTLLKGVVSGIVVIESTDNTFQTFDYRYSVSS